jgi:hypothetical protein
MNNNMYPQQVADQGRYGDSMLMHVSPGEVQGLQALALQNGTSLTTNPNTGLPEAFKLKDILPTIAGIGASFLLPGVAPWMIGAGVGGIETLRTGDLGRGLMAGLGAFGGAGVGTGLSAAGAAGSTAQAGSTLAAQPAASYAGANLAGAAAPSTFMGNLQQAGTGLSNMFSAGDVGAQARNAFIGQAANKTAGTAATGLGGGMGALQTAGAVASPFLQQAASPMPVEDPYANYKGPLKPSQRQVSYPTMRSSREWNYFSPSNPMPFAKGGAVPQLEDGGFVLTKKAVDGLGQGANNRGQRAAAMGLGALPIRGKGTGTSDSIKTTIDGKVPARVSNGEAYVPKRNVAKAGGAKKLYALMRKAERRA